MIVEIRVPMPLKTEEFNRGWLYMVVAACEEVSEGDDGAGVVVLKNEPYDNTDGHLGYSELSSQEIPKNKGQLYDVVDVEEGDEHVIVYSEDSKTDSKTWAKIYQMAWPKELKSLGPDDVKFIVKRDTTNKLLKSYFDKCANEDAKRSSKVVPSKSPKAEKAWELPVQLFHYN
eukprot:g7296.t1